MAVSTDNEIPLGKRRPLYRSFELLPAVLSYGALVLLVVLSLISPIAGSVFVLTVVGFMFIRGVRGAIDLVRGYNRYRRSARVDWAARLTDIGLTLDGRRVPPSPPGSFNVHRHRELLDMIKSNPEDYKHPSDIVHAVIIAAYNESYDVIAPTVRGLQYSTTPCDQLAIFFAYEERGGEDIKNTVERLKEEYGHKFREFELVMHPRDLPDEIAGKGANITYAGYRVQEWADAQGIDYSDVIVTTLDCDNKPYESYFDYVAYEYIADPKRKHRSYQPIALYLSNIWDAPAITRVVASANCFFNLTTTVRPTALRNFASHSQSLDALVEMDFWSKRTIVEDGHQYWRSYFHFRGDYKVTAIHVPIFQDAVLAGNMRQSIVAQFKQLSRWSYGASDVPFAAQGIADGKAPLLPGIVRFVQLLEGHVSLACVSVIIAFGGWIPVLALMQGGSTHPTFVTSIPYIVGVIQQIAMITLLVSILVFLSILTPRPVRYGKFRSFMMVGQWLLYPVTIMSFNATTALYSQGRLLIGKYREKFDVTAKSVVADADADFATAQMTSAGSFRRASALARNDYDEASHSRSELERTLR